MDPMEALELAPNPENEQLSAADLLAKADELLDSASSAHRQWLSRAAELGSVLLAVRSSKAWRIRGFETFGDYLRYAEQRFDKGRTALYGYISVAERLLPEVSESTIKEMGITKASALAQFVKQTGRRLPESLVEKARDPEITTDEFKNVVMQEMHQDAPPRGRWRDLGFFATDEEYAEIEQAIETAKQVDPVIPKNQPLWAQLKDALLRMAQEFQGTYADLVARGEG